MNEWTGDFWAHTPSDGSGGKPHDLRQHLFDTAERAKSYAAVFGAGNIAYLLGLWHDLGKYNPEFQQYLRDAQKADEEKRELGRKGPPHAIWGAALTNKMFTPKEQDKERLKNEKIALRRIVSLPIQGHHAGLDDWGCATQKLTDEIGTGPSLSIMQSAIQNFGLYPNMQLIFPLENSLKQEFFTRMITSALVDADYLDTERHFGAERPLAREQVLGVDELWTRFEDGRQRLLEKQLAEGENFRSQCSESA